jgi:hypothetical protein
MKPRFVRLIAAAALALGIAGVHPHPGFAATTISDCPTTRSQLILDMTAAGNGGTVAFNCAGNTTISSAAEILVSQTLTLDASGSSGVVTLDGGSLDRIFEVESGVSLTLNSLVITDGVQSHGDGGAILNFGTLSIANSKFTNDQVSGDLIANDHGDGGAIDNNGGSVSISNSDFSNDTAGSGSTPGSGGAIYSSGGTLTITNNSVLDNNIAEDNNGGAIDFSNTSTTITGSSLDSNQSQGGGGAIQGDSGSLSVSASSFQSNNAITGNGGAIDGIRNGNCSGFACGILITVTNSTFSGNRTFIGDGGAIFDGDALTSISGSTLSDNLAAGSGGAIYNGGTLSIGSSTLSNNSASGTTLGGGAILGVTVAVTDSTLSGNAAADGGAIYAFYDAIVNDSTIADNSASFNGGGISSTNLTTGGTILAHNAGGNCQVTVTTDSGYNLEDTSPSTCGLSSSNHDVVGQDPKLAPLGNYGGPTRTMALLSGSPAIGANTLCSVNNGTDQRGYTRLQSGGCDIGAYDTSGVAPPGNVGVTNGDARVQLSWSQVTGQNNYEIIWQDTTLNPLTDPSGTTTCNTATCTYTVTGLTNGHSYAFFVLATNGTSVGGAPAEVTTSLPSTVPTTLTFTSSSPTGGDDHDAVTLSAKLADGTGSGINGATVSFSLNSGAQSCSGTTGTDGVASCSLTPSKQPGSYPVAASFAAGSIGGTSYAASQTDPSLQFTVGAEDTHLALAQPAVAANGSALSLSATLTDPTDSTGIGGQHVSFTVGSGSSAQTCTPSTTTASDGTISCTLSSLSQPLGTETVTANFSGGDGTYQSASDSKQLLVFAYLANGAFVLGDNTAAAALNTTTTVTWWGSSWPKLNQLSGGTAPSQFKGFGANLFNNGTGTSQLSCANTNFTFFTGSGNSSSPPATVPAYMAVAASSTITATKVSTTNTKISGNVVHVYVVKTDTGYQPNPSNPGTGTVVGQVC